MAHKQFKSFYNLTNKHVHIRCLQMLKKWTDLSTITLTLYSVPKTQQQGVTAENTHNVPTQQAWRSQCTAEKYFVAARWGNTHICTMILKEQRNVVKLCLLLTFSWFTPYSRQFSSLLRRTVFLGDMVYGKPSHRNAVSFRIGTTVR